MGCTSIIACGGAGALVDMPMGHVVIPSSAVRDEVASLLAVAERRGIDFGQYLYAGDNLAGAEWDHRDWTQAVTAQRRLFELAAEAAFYLTHGLR